MDTLARPVLGKISDRAKQHVSESWDLLPQERSESPAKDKQPCASQSLPESGPLDSSKDQVMSAHVSRAFSQPLQSPILLTRAEQLGLFSQTVSVSSREQRTYGAPQCAITARESRVVGHAQSSLSPDPNIVCLSRQRVLASGFQDKMIPQYDGPTDGIDSHNDLQDDPGQQDSGPTRLNMSDLFDGRTPEQLEKSVEKSLDLLERIKQTLGEETHAKVSRWSREIASVQSQAISPKTVIGVVGATGAGKSSVINAVLDEERLLPTSCMRACTAVVTEISYNHQGGAPYRAEVEFISREDWRKTLNVLFQDILNGSGQVSSDCTNEDSASGIAYAQVKAVYPTLTREEMGQVPINKLMGHKNVAYLGTKRNIESGDVTMFYKELQPFVDSKKKTTGAKKPSEKEKKPPEAEFWPLIRVVKLYVKAAPLATGAVIVDLPGVHDSNQARAAVAREYVKQCTGMLIVAPITRAVDDKSAKTLLGDTFKRQLKMDGSLSSVTFICSRTDDISITEAKDSLGLEEELSPIWADLQALEETKEALNKQITDLEHSKNNINAATESTEDEIEVWEKLQDDLAEGKNASRPLAASLKRKLSDVNSIAGKKPKFAQPDLDHAVSASSNGCARQVGLKYSFSNTSHDQGQPLTEDDIVNKIAELANTRKELRGENRKINGQLQEMRARIGEVEREHQSTSTKLSACYIKGRNDYSRRAIRQDYAAGIRELDQELAEEGDAANFDPELHARDYDEVARNLPVFCVSSRAYQKLKGRLRKDTIHPGFQHINDTEVPALQAHCVELTATARQASSRKFLTSMFQLLNSLRLWASDDSTAQNLTQTQMDQEAQFLKEMLNNLDSALGKECDAVMGNIAKELQDKVYNAYPGATAAAQAGADETVRRWGSPINRDAPAEGGLHFQTYKAVVRRDGCFTNRQRCHNFNEQLLEPLIRQLAGPWASVFTRSLRVILDVLPVRASQVITTFHNDVQCRAVSNGASVNSFEMLKQQIPVYQEKLEVAIREARRWITEQQRTIHREFEPRIANYMHDAYDSCAREYGTGSFLRIKGSMERFVEDKKMTMFEGAADHVHGMIKEMLKGMRETLHGSLDGVFKDVQREYTSVVLRKEAGQDQRLMLDKILEIVDSAELVFKRAVGLEPEPTPQPEPEPESQPTQQPQSHTERQPEDVEMSDVAESEPGEQIFKSESDEELGRYSTELRGWVKHEEPDDVTA